MTARKKDPIKREYYCLTQDGMPVRKALKNPNNLAENFDVFYGSYHGEDGIRSQLLDDADKRPKSFKNRNELLRFFQERCGLTNEISIFNAATGEIIILGGNGEHAVTTATVKPEFKSLPTIHLESTQDKLETTQNNSEKVEESLNRIQDKLDATQTNSKNVADNLNTIQDKLDHSINFARPQIAKSVNPATHPVFKHSSSDTRVSTLMNVHGLFGTKIKTSRSLAFNKGTVSGAAQAKPTQSNFGIQLDNDGPENMISPAV